MPVTICILLANGTVTQYEWLLPTYCRPCVCLPVVLRVGVEVESLYQSVTMMSLPI